MTRPETVTTGRLSIGYLGCGPAHGPPVVLLHGFPYDVHAYDEVAPVLAGHGARVVVPYLRGFGPTRFRSGATPRSGEQAALGQDLLDLLDALELGPAVLAGYDWGGRAACVVAAVRPERVRGLVTADGYNIQPPPDGATQPAAPEDEHRHWYQYYLHGERGRNGLAADRRAFCRLLWQLWSPTWHFTDRTFARTAPAFDNPDFVDVVVHSYRVRYGLAEPDAAYAGLRSKLAELPDITVPTVVLDPADDGVVTTGTTADPLARFTGPVAYRLLQGVGHDVPQEAPRDVARAVLDLLEGLPHHGSPAAAS